jgi:hypothetical protein
MKGIWRNGVAVLILLFGVVAVVEANVSCSALANHMFTSATRAVYWAKRYYNAGRGDVEVFRVPVPGALPSELSDSEYSSVDKDEHKHLAESIEAFVKKDYKEAIEHAKRQQEGDQHVVSRIVGVCSCALHDQKGVHEALAASDEEGKELVKYACQHYKTDVRAESED